MRGVFSRWSLPSPWSRVEAEHEAAFVCDHCNHRNHCRNGSLNLILTRCTGAPRGSVAAGSSDHTFNPPRLVSTRRCRTQSFAP